MKLTTFKNKLEKTNERLNNRNAKKYMDSTIEKFNNSQDKFKCSFPGEVFNYGWVDLDIESDKSCETIRISLP